MNTDLNTTPPPSASTPDILPLPATGFLRIKQILQFIPVSDVTWWNGVKAGRFPKSIKLGERTTVWRAEDIRALIDRLGNEDAEV